MVWSLPLLEADPDDDAWIRSGVGLASDEVVFVTAKVGADDYTTSAIGSRPANASSR